MPTRSVRGYQEVPHTADWALRVWAEDLPALFSEAARGMNALQGVQLDHGPRARRTLKLEAGDAESLLVAFLSELLYLQERDRLGFEQVHIEVRGTRLKADMEGARLAAVEKPIKAVTYHNLEIKCTQRGCEVELVFDV